MTHNALPDWVNLPPLVPGKAPQDTTVVVAMSGGVDSSCAAALCQRLGYKTIGMTLQLWDYTPASEAVADPASPEEGFAGRKVADQGAKGSLVQPKRFGTCCALDDVYDARMVCQTIGIPHYVLNMESAFKGAVIDDFVETYLAGATPIPCVRCNQRIKFKELLDKAKGLGADVLVTGHYVRKDYVPVTENQEKRDSSLPPSPRLRRTGRWNDANASKGAGPLDPPATPKMRAVLKRGDDPAKDQSYYLFTTTQEQLEFINFPLGTFEKPRVRELAKWLGIHNHSKKDSQDICFVPGGDYRKVVKKFAPEADAPGDIVLEDGTKVGRHDGIVGFTVGQRKGLPGGSAEALYVVEIRPATREVVVGPRSSLGRTVFTVKELNWLGGDEESLPVLVKVRAQHKGAAGVLNMLGNGRAEVVLAEAEEQVSPGQAGVFYDDAGVMLGGGWIEMMPSLPKGPVRVAIS